MERRFLSCSKIYIGLALWFGVWAFGAKNSNYITQGSQNPPQPASYAASTDSLHQAQAESDSSQIVRHDFNHREQVIVGGVIMACLALILAIMNNYNPKE